MNPDYWISRWERGETGFHAEAVQPGLEAGLKRLNPDRPLNVLVPLCGKSVDMLHLAAAGHSVHGVDVADTACRQFFEEAGLAPEAVLDHGFIRRNASGVTLWTGDYFDFTLKRSGRIDLVVDRAALVALPAPMRARYARHTARLAAGAAIILITFTYSHPEVIGPPFSVPDREVRALYGASFAMESVLQRRLETYPGSKMARHGIHFLEETTWLMRPLAKIP